MFNFRQYNLKKLNFPILVVVLSLSIVSLIVVNIVSDQLFIKQLIGLILGIILCAAISIIDYHTICSYAVIFYIISVVSLILVQIPGIGYTKNNATRWVNIFGIKLQPSEMAKVFTIIVMTQFFTIFKDSINEAKTIVIGFVVALVPIILIFIQPDLSSSLVILFFLFIMLYSAGISNRIVVTGLLLFIPICGLGFWYILQPGQKLLNEYQQIRILGLLHPDEYADKMFQQNKSVAVITRGKLYGIFNNSTGTEELGSKKLPIVESDFIFAAISEILGFIGTVVIMALLMILILKCLSVAKKAKDSTGKLLCVGVSAMFMFQVFANIGVVTRILPNTGLPLPFLSSGLSSSFSFFMAIGMVINVGLQSKK